MVVTFILKSGKIAQNIIFVNSGKIAQNIIFDYVTKKTCTIIDTLRKKNMGTKHTVKMM